MGAIYISVGHNDDLVIAKFAGVIIVAETGTKGGDNRTDFFVSQHLIETRFFDIDGKNKSRSDIRGFLVQERERLQWRSAERQVSGETEEVSCARVLVIEEC